MMIDKVLLDSILSINWSEISYLLGKNWLSTKASTTVEIYENYNPNKIHHETIKKNG
jgi:hypothetical protein